MKNLIFKVLVFLIDWYEHKILPNECIGQTYYIQDQIVTYSYKTGLDKLDFYLRYRYRETNNKRFKNFCDRISVIRRKYQVIKNSVFPTEIRRRFRCFIEDYKKGINEIYGLKKLCFVRNLQAKGFNSEIINFLLADRIKYKDCPEHLIRIDKAINNLLPKDMQIKNIDI